MKSLQSEAKSYRDKAVAELTSDDDSRLEFAALSIRKAIEYLTYDRLNAYHKEINLNLYRTWQPRKVFQHLCEIDPLAAEERKISKAITDPSRSIEDQDYELVGVEKPINISVLKDSYNKLGSFLHAPTLKQINEEKPRPQDFKSLRATCNDLISEIDRVLSSSVWLPAMGRFSQFECRRCNDIALYRSLSNREKKKVLCSHCNAPHTAHMDDKGNITIVPHIGRLECNTENCNHIHEFWEDEFEYEKRFTCEECNSNYRFIYSIQPLVDGSSNK